MECGRLGRARRASGPAVHAIGWDARSARARRPRSTWCTGSCAEGPRPNGDLTHMHGNLGVATMLRKSCGRTPVLPALSCERGIGRCCALYVRGDPDGRLGGGRPRASRGGGAPLRALRRRHCRMAGRLRQDVRRHECGQLSAIGRNHRRGHGHRPSRR